MSDDRHVNDPLGVYQDFRDKADPPDGFAGAKLLGYAVAIVAMLGVVVVGLLSTFGVL